MSCGFTKMTTACFFFSLSLSFLHALIQINVLITERKLIKLFACDSPYLSLAATFVHPTLCVQPPTHLPSHPHITWLSYIPYGSFYFCGDSLEHFLLSICWLCRKDNSDFRPVFVSALSCQSVQLKNRCMFWMQIFEHFSILYSHKVHE